MLGGVSSMLGGTSATSKATSATLGTTSALAETNETNVATNVTNITTLDGSAAALNTHVKTQGVNIGTNTTNITSNDSDILTNEGSINRIITLIGGVSGTSGIDFLGGDTPTLLNDLDADGNDILMKKGSGANGGNILMDGGNLSGVTYLRPGPNNNILLSGAQSYILGLNEVYLGDTVAGANTSGLLHIINNLASVSGAGGSTASASFASGLAVYNGSGVYMSGMGEEPDIPDLAKPGDGYTLSLDTLNEVMVWRKSPFVVGEDGEQISLGGGVDENATFDMGGADFLQTGSAKILGREIHVANDLSGAATCTTILDSSASISGCPYPPPFSFVRSTANLGAGVDNFYFGSGVTADETTMGSDGISFDLTNGYWNIDSAGWYEVTAAIGINCTVTPSIVKNYVLTTAGYGGAEILLTFTTTLLRTNIDPHLTVAHWLGYLGAGIKLAIKCDTDAGAITSERYSTASVKRIG